MRRETRDITTLELVPVTGERPDYQPGQFNMLYVFGVGEVAISISGDPAAAGSYVHTVRDVGAVSGAIARLAAGAMLGVRGPYGTPGRSRPPRAATWCSWPAGSAWRRCGRRSTRCWRTAERYGRVVLLYGTRSPADILFRQELERWRRRLDVEILVTVDHADADWRGDVGVVPKLIARAGFDPHNAVAMVCGPEVMMRFTADALRRAGRRVGPDLSVDGAQHEMCHRPVRSLPVRSGFRLQGWPGHALRPHRRHPRPCGRSEMAAKRKPRLAVWKFASCDGCQLSLLDCEDELLAVAGAVDIAYFPEASSVMAKGPYDLSLVEGSITTPHDAERIHKIRRQSKALVTIGACATAGGIQALRNFADVQRHGRRRLCDAEIHQDAGDLDADFRPREGGFRTARLPDQQGAVAGGAVGLPGRPQAGDRRATASASSASCAAQPASWCRGRPASARSRMPAAVRSARRINRGCYGCFGPMERPNTAALAAEWQRLGATPRDIQRVFRTFNAAAEPFRKESDAHGD